jgi:hypothetical protein
MKEREIPGQDPPTEVEEVAAAVAGRAAVEGVLLDAHSDPERFL